ncbi:type VI secretion system baseplate subunit TssG [bacterium]|nr:type VI secretion system baseplate subunit TssG [candidate division CSSED10-310 bacterium]
MNITKLNFKELRSNIRTYDFYSAVSVLNSIGYKLGKDLRVIPRRGGFFPGTNLDELVEGFKYADFDNISEQDERDLGQYSSLVVNFLGLYGPSSILPFYFNFLISTDDVVGNNLAGLLELINDRIYQYLYRIWAVPRRIDRVEKEHKDDQFNILACCGLDRNLLSIPLDAIQVSYLAHPTRSVWGLKQFASDVFKVGVEIQQNKMFQITLSDDACTMLGSSANRLGSDFIIGKEIRDISMHYCLLLGPLTLEEYNSFLPGQDKHRVLLKMLDLYTPFHLRYEITWQIHAEESRKMKWYLGNQYSRLGLATVIKAETRDTPLIVRWRKPDSTVCSIEKLRYVNNRNNIIVESNIT